MITHFEVIQKDNPNPKYTAQDIEDFYTLFALAEKGGKPTVLVTSQLPYRFVTSTNVVTYQIIDDKPITLERLRQIHNTHCEALNSIAV